MSPPKVHDLARVSDITQFEIFANFEKLSDAASTFEDGPMLLASTGVKFAYFNVAFVRGPVADPVAFVATAKEWFGERGVPWRICGRVGFTDAVGHAALEAGLQSDKVMEGMTIGQLPTSSTYPGISVELVEDLETLEAYAGTVALAYGMPVEVARTLTPSSVLDDPKMVLLLARIEGVPAATSLLFVTEDIAGVYNVGTIKEFRKRGLGGAVTEATLIEGARRGCTIGALQPSEMGRPVYAKLGFVSSALYLQFATPQPAVS